MPRVPFTSIFRTKTDGTIEVLQSARIGGVSITPGSVLRPGQIIGGIDLTQYIKNDFEIDIKDNVIVITGIYGATQ